MTLPTGYSRESGPVAMQAAGWLVNDYSAQAAHWYIWAPVSGEQSLVVPFRSSHEEIGDVSASSRLIVSLRDKTIITQRLWEEATSPPVGARTRLGKRLRELRKKYRASGERLLEWDDIAREIQERRGQRNVGDFE